MSLCRPNISWSALSSDNLSDKNCISFTFGGPGRTYRIKSRCWNDIGLSIYVVRRGDQEFEAQAFTKCRLPLKVYLSRKTKIQRLKSSMHLEDDLEVGRARIMILKMPAGGTERHQRSEDKAPKSGTPGPGVHHDLSTKSYPLLSNTNAIKTISSGRAHQSFSEAASFS